MNYLITTDKITIIIPLFCMDENGLERFENSLSSIVESNLEDVEKLIIDGWVRDDKLWGDVKELVTNIVTIDYTLKRRKINVGKSTIINEHIKDIKTELVCLSDSDIVVRTETIQRLKSLAEYYDIVIPDQTEDCRHYKLVHNTIEIKNNESVYVIKTPEGVAGGFLLLKTKILKEIPFENKGPYGADDVEFFQKAVKKYSVVICGDIFVTHPFDTNKKYYDWKLKMSLSSYKKLTDKEIEERIDYFNNYFSK